MSVGWMKPRALVPSAHRCIRFLRPRVTSLPLDNEEQSVAACNDAPYLLLRTSSSSISAPKSNLSPTHANESQPECTPSCTAASTSATSAVQMEDNTWRTLATAAAVAVTLGWIAGPASAASSDDSRPDQQRYPGRAGRMHRAVGGNEAEQAAWRAVEVDRRRIEAQQKREKRQARSQMVQSAPYKVAGVHISPLFFWGALIGTVYWSTQTDAGMRFVRDLTGRAKRGGQWVYDRSLKGRKVPVSQGGSAGGSSRGLRDEDFTALTSIATAARSKLDASPTGSQRPPWWDPPAPIMNASSSAQATAQQKANRILNRIVEGKVQGVDYRLDDIVRLREACQSGGVRVIPKTVGGRDAIYRAAVEGALAASMEPNADTDLGDATPIGFLSAIASDLGVSEDRAVSLITSATISKCRSRLLDALTALKDSNEMGVMLALIPLASLLENMPVLAAGGKEVALIASSLTASSSMEERKQIFLTFGELYEDGCLVVAEMLGFDPDLAVSTFKAMKEGRQA